MHNDDTFFLPEFIVHENFIFSKFHSLVQIRHLPLLFPCLARGTVSVVSSQSGQHGKDKGISKVVGKKEKRKKKTCPIPSAVIHTFFLFSSFP